MRHKLATVPICLSQGDPADLLAKAEDLESRSQWFRAAEEYLTLAKTLNKNHALPREAAQAYVRAATCFELSNQNRDAGRAYFEGASLLHNQKISFQQAGEVFNRAAFCFKSIQEYFNSGDSYRRAAAAFAESETDMIDTQDNIPPIPGGAGKYTVAAYCYTAAAYAFAESDLAWARSAYWDAGRMHMRQGHGYHAYVAFRKALATCIQFDHTHDGDQLRKALPLTEEERSRKIDPIKMMENAALQGWKSHQEINTHIYSSEWPRLMTDKEMISSFHEFYLGFTKIGNHREASQYHAMEQKRKQAIFWREKRFPKALGSLVWEVSCGYGESLGRWTLVCLGIWIAFGLVYAHLNLIEGASWPSYLYSSLVIFTNFGSGDLRTAGTVAETLIAFESLLGLLMMGMLLTYIARRIFR